MRRTTILTMVAVMALALPATAITNGTPDDDQRFPHVGQLLFYVPDAFDSRFDDPGSWFTCSGALLQDDAIDGAVVLTAGHCTFAVGLNGETTTDIDGNGIGGDSPAVTGGVWDNGDYVGNGVGGNDIWVSFERESNFSILPASSSFERHENQDRYEAWSAALDSSVTWHRGVANTHPYYNDFAFYAYDVGVVSLLGDAPNTGGAFGTLPTAGYLDTFQGRAKAQSRFTPVGYGLQRGFPYFSGGDTREYADVMLIDARGVFGIGSIHPGTAVVFSNNSGKAHRGGTCFGDSGGPTFEAGTTTIVAVTSFGINLNCVGTGGGYRIDKALDLAWIRSH